MVNLTGTRRGAMAAQVIERTKEVDRRMEVFDAPNVTPCAHYWVIEPANGPVSQGACQVCGEVRGFKNFVES
jgi:hypothetical protein